jgi:TetR/AcrR family transcriptional regulator
MGNPKSRFGAWSKIIAKGRRSLASRDPFDAGRLTTLPHATTLLTNESVISTSTLSRPSPSSPSPSRQRRKADRPHELLEAALTLFVEKGLAATRQEEVAKLAGVSKGTLYLYYPSKDELFKAVIQAYLTQVLVEGGELVDQFEGSTSELLRLLGQTWWSRVGSSKAAGLLILIMAEARKFPELAQFYVDEVVAPSHALLARVVQRGMARGEFRHVDVPSVVHALIAPMQFLIIYQQCTAVCAVNPVPLIPEQFMDTQMDLLLRGLEIRGAAPAAKTPRTSS